MVDLRDCPSLKMRKWPARALVTPLALTILALTLTLVPNTRAQPSERDQEKDCGQYQTCTAGFHVQFQGVEVPPCGEMVELTATQMKPVLRLKPDDDEEPKDVLILMVDPDAPTNKNCRYYLHWVATATQQSNGTFTSPADKVDYFPPSPPSGQVHRYQLLLYPKPEEEVKNAERGGNFDLQKFKETNGLKKLVASFQFRIGTQE